MSINKVLSTDARQSVNFADSDDVLTHFVEKCLSEKAKMLVRDKMQWVGALAAGKMNELSMLADKHTPELVKRDFYGNDINKIAFHPAYKELTQIAVETGMFWLKWRPDLREQFAAERHRMGFAVGFLFAMSESGLYCPLCMTDGAALLIDKYCAESDKERLMPHIYTENAEEFYTGAMFLTEKAGGSDVGANIVAASAAGRFQSKSLYYLEGEKWFCSNANAEIMFVLARTNAEVKGTKGLSIFLVEPTHDVFGARQRNNINFVRLKDKLGVRSMASAECIFENAIGKLVGKEFEGFKIMTDMINLSRLYNAVAAVSLSRRALVEAYQFLSFRSTFGKNVLEHALVRTRLTELQSLYLANFYLAWRTITALDNADNGDANEAELLRLLTPITKRSTAQDGVYICRESMELMGGMGYIEDGVMPKIMRDMMVLPIWEGAGNIMVLDALRALHKSKGWAVMYSEMQTIFSAQNQELSQQLLALLDGLNPDIFTNLPQPQLEATALPWVERVTRLFQMSLLLRYSDSVSQAWTMPAFHWLLQQNTKSNKIEIETPLSREAVEAMMGWRF